MSVQSKSTFELARQAAIFLLPVRIVLDVDATHPAGARRAQVTLQGSLRFEPLAVDVIAREAESARARGQLERRTSIPIVPGEEIVPIPRSQIPSRLAGRTYVGIQLIDEQRRALTREILMDRHSQSWKSIEARVFVPVRARFEASVAPGEDGDPARLGLRGSVRISAISARLSFRKRVVFRNERGPRADRRVGTILCNELVELLRPGQSFEVPASTLIASGGKRASIWAQWRHGTGEPIGQAWSLGR